MLTMHDIVSSCLLSTTVNTKTSLLYVVIVIGALYFISF